MGRDWIRTMSMTVQKFEPTSAAVRHQTPPVWDMSQERALCETLLARRINFFLVFYSIVLAGGLQADSQFELRLVYGVGTLICVLFATVLVQSQQKLDLILGELLSDESHPAAIVSRKGTSLGQPRILSVWIPRLCCAILAAVFVLTLFDLVSVPTQL